MCTCSEIYTHTFRFELRAWVFAERNATTTVVDDAEEEGDEEAGQEEKEEKERRTDGELAGPTCLRRRPPFPFPPHVTPSLGRSERFACTGACISPRRCVWPATIRVWNSNSAAQLSESRSSVGWDDRGWRDAWKRFIPSRVCALVGGLYGIERHRIG